MAAFCEMDVSGFQANTAGQDPSYCASFPTGCPAPAAAYTFLDTPDLRYLPPDQPQGFFFSNAYIGVESLANQSLIVYDGVSYDWNNYVATPWPATWRLMGFGLVALAGRVRGRAARV